MSATAAQELAEISYVILEAIRSRNRARLEEILRPDFAHVNEGGIRLDKGAFLSAIEAGDYQIEELAFDTISIEHFDGVGIVCGVQRAVVGLVGGERVEGRTAFTDVFVAGPDGWKLQFASSAELATTPSSPV